MSAMSSSSNLNARQKELLIDGLQMRICHIETSTTHMRATDAQQFNATPRRGRMHGIGPRPVAINALVPSQMELVLEMEALIKQLKT